VWVNPLASDMLLDKFTDRSVSAAIRRGGAEMYPDGKQILRDTIGEELRGKMNGRSFVAPATVIDTSPGSLRKSNGVRRIFHVATIRLAFDDQPVVDVETLDRCVANALAAVERAGTYRSVLFPMIGTGQHALRVNQVAPRLIERAIGFFTANPGSHINRIYFLAYSAIDAEILHDAFEKFETSFEPLEASAAGQAPA